MKLSYLYLMPFLAFLIVGCSSVPEKETSNCANGTTDVDGICVSQEWANFISCVNSQSVDLSKEIKSSYNASVSYLGSSIQGGKEAVENINKKYSASDDVKKIVINKCGEMTGFLSSGVQSTLKKSSPTLPEKITKPVEPVEPIDTVVSNGYIYDLYSCNNIGRNLKCNFTIMSENRNQAHFHRQTRNGSSNIYYSNGDVATAYKISLGKASSIKERFGIRLAPGVPIKGSIEFLGVNTSSIQMLEISVATTVLHIPQYARFSNIKVGRE
ncbi:hypothetical protein [Vibrio fortis]|uniref:hypothetical protein n=1 Tax=Vibrio fortis TaxID=212667 RepID=UPI0036F19E2C